MIILTDKPQQKHHFAGVCYLSSILIQPVMKVFLKILAILCCFSTAYGQDVRIASRWTPKKNGFYAGVEGVILANRDTQFNSRPPALSAGDKALEPTPALLAGYRITSRFSVEAGLYALPVATSYSYQNTKQHDYFANSYTGTYLYLPLRGVFQIYGVGHRLGLSLLAGGGPAFTDLSPGQLITPNYTTVSTTTYPDGSSRTQTATQSATHEQGSCAVFEGGVRGQYLITPRLSLNLTVRQLWSPISSVRDIRLSISTPSEHLTATMTTPLQGVSTGLGVYYSF